MVCSPLWVWPVGPSRMGPPFLLSEPNTNYSPAADPRGGSGVGRRDFPRPLGPSGCFSTLKGLALPLYHPSDSLALEPPTPAVPFTFFFFLNPEIQRGLVGTSVVKGGPKGEEWTGSQESFILVVIILTVGKWEGENQTIKTAHGLIPIQAPLFM